MDEDVSVRAIMIGVSVLIAVATISAVLTYYNSAKELVRKIGSGTDIAGLYDKSVEDTLLKGTITGTEVKNILNYFYDRQDVEVNMTDVKVYESNSDSDMAEVVTLNNTTTDLDNIASSSKANYKKVIKSILPNSRYKVETSVENYITKVNIALQN